MQEKILGFIGIFFVLLSRQSNKVMILQPLRKKTSSRLSELQTRMLTLWSWWNYIRFSWCFGITGRFLHVDNICRRAGLFVQSGVRLQSEMWILFSAPSWAIRLGRIFGQAKMLVLGKQSLSLWTRAMSSFHFLNLVVSPQHMVGNQNIHRKAEKQMCHYMSGYRVNYAPPILLRRVKGDDWGRTAGGLLFSPGKKWRRRGWIHRLLGKANLGLPLTSPMNPRVL